MIYVSDIQAYFQSFILESSHCLFELNVVVENFQGFLPQSLRGHFIEDLIFLIATVKPLDDGCNILNLSADDEVAHFF